MTHQGTDTHTLSCSPHFVHLAFFLQQRNADTVSTPTMVHSSPSTPQHQADPVAVFGRLKAQFEELSQREAAVRAKEEDLKKNESAKDRKYETLFAQLKAREEKLMVRLGAVTVRETQVERKEEGLKERQLAVEKQQKRMDEQDDRLFGREMTVAKAEDDLKKRQKQSKLLPIPRSNNR